MRQLPDPLDNPVTGHLYRRGDVLSALLHGETRDSPSLARVCRDDLLRIVAAGEFPEDSIGDGYSVEVLDPDRAVITFNWDVSRRQDVPLSEILDALDLIIEHGRPR